MTAPHLQCLAVGHTEGEMIQAGAKLAKRLSRVRLMNGQDDPERVGGMKQDDLAAAPLHIFHFPAFLQAQDGSVPGHASLEIGYGYVEIMDATKLRHNSSFGDDF